MREVVNLNLIISKLPLVFILCFGAFLIFFGINYDLPFIFHPDEPTNFEVSRRMFSLGTLNPLFFSYPSLSFYANFLAIGPYYLFGKLSGTLNTTYDIQKLVVLGMGIVKTNQPNLILLTRSISACFGIGCIFLIYLISRRLLPNSPLRYFSAFAAASCLSIVSLSKTITPDIFAAFFVLLTVYFSLFILKENARKWYILAGLAIGFAASSKYNVALVAVVAPSAHFLRLGWRGWKDPNLFIAAAISFLGFLLTTPYAYKERDLFLFHLESEGAHYSTGHLGMEGDSILWYISNLWKNLSLLLPLALAQISIGIFKKNKETILVSVFVAVYFGFICTFNVRNERTILPIVPLLLILAGVSVHSISEFVEKRVLKNRFDITGSHLFPFILILPLLMDSISFDRKLFHPKARNEARIWIENELPEGTKIAIENYSPFVDPQKYNISAIGYAIDHPPDWYVNQGFDVLILSKISFGRFYADPEKYSGKIEKYESLIRRLHLQKAFFDEDEEVRVYRIK
ncbi:phospholipid carrier-dependent glycosyltransferase [Leptospira wolffii]|nr:phospholipid carrier-dependent glycosyltransferase [Leptospira wolffii]TGK65987.1 phospholipid carrier-dependent glycosyltransferase [Leptospira wolffii]TGK74172.1 phospholipid carrier-dependent glycosyltransferase [Leptospira wolffii]TGL29031.1 phospholipid carrier-dependent glycosyltransferase [Leptospira wolffii]